MTLATHRIRGGIARRSRFLLLASVFAVAAHPAFAQSNSAQEAPEAEEVVVTGSLVERSGFDTPTPVTVIGMDAIERVAAPSIADVINQMPSVRPSLTPTSAVNAGGSTQTGGNFLDLRGLGYARTMVLLDGRRYVPTNPTGAVSINNIPQALIDRVDIVTGGASAAYGADAVAGVVNLRINSKMQGVRATLQGGMAEEGDYRQILASVAAGTKVTDRLHLVVGGEFSDNSGINRLFDRDWSACGPGLLANPNAGDRGNGTPEQPRFFVTKCGVRSSNATYAGVVTGLNWVPGTLDPVTGNPKPGITAITGLPSYLKGIQFANDGRATPFNFGTQVTSGSMLGGDGLNSVAEQVGATPITRYSGFGRLTWEVGSSFELFAELSYHKFNSEQDNIPSSFQYTLRSDNVFLPAALRQTMIDNSVASIVVGKNNLDHGRVRTRFDTDTLQATVGLSGEFAPGWKVDAYYGYGRNYTENHGRNVRVTGNYTLAIDAIDDPRTPGIVDPICRSTIANPGNGCVPLNLLGIVKPGDPALLYVNGFQRFTSDIRQNTIAATVRGKPFSTWAGPVAFAIGAEYRDQDLAVDYDLRSQAGAFGAPSLPYSGQVHVKELFGELMIPLLKDSSLGRRLSLDLAGRITDYSTSGTVKTWKAGLDYSLNDSIRFRATRSRDIRAPSLAELFQRSGSSNLSVTDKDPRSTYSGQSYQVIALTAGNPNLKPEIADTFTGGMVVTPSAIPGLRVSVDYYDIQIKDAIIQITPAATVDQCYSTNPAACAFITRGDDGRISHVFSGPVNLASAMTRGIDFELQYSLPVGTDRVAFQTLVNYLIKTQLDDGIVKTRLDNSMSQPTVAALGGNPRWKANVNASYIADDFRFSGTARYVGGGYIDRTMTAKDLDRLTVKGRVYFDISGELTLFKPKGEGSKVALFVAVQNLLDTDPPITGAGGYGTTRGLFDTIGRQFIGGVRLNF